MYPLCLRIAVLTSFTKSRKVKRVLSGALFTLREERKQLLVSVRDLERLFYIEHSEIEKYPRR